jgi:hypothetical protein
MSSANEISAVELMLFRRGADLTLFLANRLGDEIYESPDLTSFKEAGAVSAYLRVAMAATDIMNLAEGPGATRSPLMLACDGLQRALDLAPTVSRSMLDSLKVRDVHALDTLRRWSA